MTQKEKNGSSQYNVTHQELHKTHTHWLKKKKKRVTKNFSLFPKNQTGYISLPISFLLLVSLDLTFHQEHNHLLCYITRVRQQRKLVFNHVWNLRLLQMSKR